MLQPIVPYLMRRVKFVEGKELRVLEPNATTCGARRSAEVGPELLARKQQVEDVVLVTRSAHEVDGRDDRVVGCDHARGRTAAVLKRADTHLASALHRRGRLFFRPSRVVPFVVHQWSSTEGLAGLDARDEKDVISRLVGLFHAAGRMGD